jgi:hypothetical protein
MQLIKSELVARSDTDQLAGNIDTRLQHYWERKEMRTAVRIRGAWSAERNPSMIYFAPLTALPPMAMISFLWFTRGYLNF